jgi:hypothetical protein
MELPMTRTSFRLALGLGCLIAMAACSSDQDAAAEPAETTDDTVETVAAPAAETPAGETAADDPLGAADVPAIEAGLSAEIELLTQVADEVAKGVEPERYTELALSVHDDSVAAGVRASGIDAPRYDRLKEEVFAVLGAVEMRAMLQKQAAEADTAGLDADTQAEMKRNQQAMLDSVPDPYAALDPILAEALRAREPRLMELRAQNVGLLFKIAQH